MQDARRRVRFCRPSLSLEKDSNTIGETIGRFFAEYMPQHQLIVDPQRPSYEVYYEHTMDFCVPIL